MTGDAFADADAYESWVRTPLGAFVDTGAGTGHFATVAQGHQVIAVEPSAAMTAVGRPHPPVRPSIGPQAWASDSLSRRRRRTER